MRGKANAFDRALGRRLRTARLAAGLPVTTVADKMQLSYQMICKYEAGYARLSIQSAIRLAEIYHVGVLWLIGCAQTDVVFKAPT